MSTHLAPPELELRIGLSSCGIASGAEAVRDALLAAAGPDAVVKSVGCNGMCHCEPVVQVFESGRLTALYANVTPALARHIASASSTAELAEHRLDPYSGSAAAYLSKQRRIVLENCGAVDPHRIDDYLARGGYQALTSCLDHPRHLSPEDVIRIITESGLRGRGGAGFPTGRKWALARRQPGPPRFVICNGDEGDPGAFMDRLVLEADPHRVLEGLAIAAYAIGATEGFLYIRTEYPLALQNVREAIRQAEQLGFLGPHIHGCEFSLKLAVREGAGAFVCGEETALIRSLEGGRGTPRLRPPYPVEHGFRNAPTVINNVETLACVPWILRHGAAAFSALGTASSKGTKVFALAGKIRRGGLIEVPMGTTLREIVEDIGGGAPQGREFKAVQIGGPSGGCIPASLADTPVDYDAIPTTGAIMGSGGLVVLDDASCMVDVARFFLHFTQSESCGLCTLCRIGTRRMLEILDRLCQGTALPDDLPTLETLANGVSLGSLCGLGQTAPNPVTTTLRYFRDEYEAHAYERRCPALHCPALIRYFITDNCTACNACADACPVGAISSQSDGPYQIDSHLCTRCDECRKICPCDAVEVASPC